jgi:hypothetical protein
VKTRSSERYLARVWRVFRANPRALWSLRVVLGLAVVALLADFIANDKPYWIELDGEWYFPIATEYGVDLGLRRWPEPLLNADFKRLGEEHARTRPPGSTCTVPPSRRRRPTTGWAPTSLGATWRPG